MSSLNAGGAASRANTGPGHLTANLPHPSRLPGDGDRESDFMLSNHMRMNNNFGSDYNTSDYIASSQMPNNDKVYK